MIMTYEPGAQIQINKSVIKKAILQGSMCETNEKNDIILKKVHNLGGISSFEKNLTFMQ